MLFRLTLQTRQLAARLPAILPSTCALCGMAGRETLCPGCRKQYVVPRSACCG